MAQCRIHLQQSLPAVCLCCDTNASHYCKQTFINTNPWTLWTLPLGTWYYNWIVLHIPLCDAHRNTIRYRWVGPLTFLALGGLTIFASWGIYNSIFGKEAGDAIAPWAGGAAAILFVAFYIALTYVSFTKPYVSRMQGDYITLSKVSQRFAAVVRGDDVPVIMAELADATPLDSPFGLPVATAVLPPTVAKPKPSTTSSNLVWIWLLGIGAALSLFLITAGGIAIALNASPSQPVSITVETAPTKFLMNGSAQLKVTYRAVGALDDRDQYAWVIKHGDQTLRPRFMSTWELRQGGVVEFHVFDPRASSAEIWLETIPWGGGEPKKASNVARVTTG